MSVLELGDKFVDERGKIGTLTSMLKTTTSTLQGNVNVEYIGIVNGEAILGANVFKDLFASVRDIVGGRSAAYERELDRARKIAMDEMVAAAEELGANGIVGIDIDYETIGSGSMLMVAVCGTAVRIS